jgi:hypothetical protein
MSISDYDEHTEDMDDGIDSLASTLSPKTPVDSHHTDTAILQSDKSKKDKRGIVVPAEQRVEEEEDFSYFD